MLIAPDRDLAGSCSIEQIRCFCHKRKARSMTIIEIRPIRNGWKCFEAPGMQPVLLSQQDAISYAKGSACFRSGEIRILDSSGAIKRIIPFSETDRRL